MPRQSILDSLWLQADTRGDETAALVKDGKTFVPVTWTQLGERVDKVSQALRDAGVQTGDRVAILMQTRLEWAVVDLAIAGAGAISVPIYASNLSDECAFIIENSGCKLAFCEDRVQVDKFITQGGLQAPLTKVVQLNAPLSTEPAAMALEAAGQLLMFDAFIDQTTVDKTALRAIQADLKGDSPFSIIYTSGTTGRPKGVVSTHDNMLYIAEAIEQIDVLRRTDIELLILPLAHVFARILEIAWIAIGHVMAFAESMKTVQADMALVRPHIMAGVPRVFEKFYNAVMEKGRAKGGLAARALGRAAHTSSQRGEALMANRAPRWRTQLEYHLWHASIFKTVGKGLQASMGGRMRVLVSGGAPLSPNIAWFFDDAGVNIIEGFGLTETMAATCVNRPERNRIGTVGPPLPGTEAKLADDDELMFRGRSVMAGYWQNPAATQEVMAGEWLKTGDIAKIDADGSIRIVDRKKDLIVTAGGKNVAPQNIENMLKAHPLISQVVVHGDRRPYLTALVTLDTEALARFATAHALGNSSHAQLSAHPMVVSEIDQTIAAINAQLPRYETIKKHKILPVDFSVETGELTPSLKIKRRVINQRYRDILDGFYAS